VLGYDKRMLFSVDIFSPSFIVVESKEGLLPFYDNGHPPGTSQQYNQKRKK
jgi:hypothetical protein